MQAATHDLSGLTITAVEPVLLSYPYPEHDVQRWSGGTLAGVTAGLVRVRTVDGMTGVGETYAGTFAPGVVTALVQHFAPMVMGQDASRVVELIEGCYSAVLYWGRTGIAVSVLSALEAALWDLCGKAAGKPVLELLGGPCHERLPRYASGGMESGEAKLRAEQRGYAGEGYVATKIRGGTGLEDDYLKAALVREAIGPSVGLAVDAVQGSHPRPWGAAEAIEVGRRLQELDLLWFEEPCAALDIEGYVACRRALDVPIAGGESCTTAAELGRLVSAGALDIVQPDAAHIGGIVETLRAGDLAERAGLAAAVHAWAGGGCLMANYHAAFAMPSCRWLEFPTQPNPLITELLAEPLVVENGHVLAPTAPGLGLVLTPEIEEKYPYRPGNHYRFAERR